MKYIGFLWLFGVSIAGVQCTTHWMVTESGLIEPWLDSPYELARPHDLLTFINHDKKWEGIQSMYHELLKEHESLQENWDSLIKKTDVSAHIAKDKNCEAASHLTTVDYYDTMLEDGRSKNINIKGIGGFDSLYGDKVKIPDCKKISSLTFSMFAFEHLEGMVQRENLTMDAESRDNWPLDMEGSKVLSIEQFGSWVTNQLKHNSSSWLYYNMASLYWRVRGHAAKAMECSRRAVHYAPRYYKDIALLSMGTIFHRSKKSEDAITVLTAAMDHDPHFAYHQFMLGNAYAVLGDFNNSLKYYDNCLKLKFDNVLKYKPGVLCFSAVMKHLKRMKLKFENFKESLVDYQAKKDSWIEEQVSFLKAMKHVEEFNTNDPDLNAQKMSDLTGLNIVELKRNGRKWSAMNLLVQGPEDKMYLKKGPDIIDAAYEFQRYLKNIIKHTNMLSELASQNDVNIDSNKGFNYRNQEKPVVKQVRRESLFAEVLKSAVEEMKERIKNEEDKWKIIDQAERTKIEAERAGEERKQKAKQSFSQFDTGVFLYPSTVKVNRNTEDFDTDPDWPSHELCRDSYDKLPGHPNYVYPAFLPFENKGIRLNSLLSDMIGVPLTREHELPWHPPVCDPPAPHRKPKQQMEVLGQDYLREKLREYAGAGDPASVSDMHDAELGQRIHTAIQMEVAPKWILYTLSSLYWRVRGNPSAALSCLLSASKLVPARVKDVVLTSLASVYMELGYVDEAFTAAEQAFKIGVYEPATNFVLAQLNMMREEEAAQMFHLKQCVRLEPEHAGGAASRLLRAWGCGLRARGDAIREPIELLRMFDATEGSPTRGMSRDSDLFDPYIRDMPDPSNKRASQAHYDSVMNVVNRELRGCRDHGCNQFDADEILVKEEECYHQQLQLGYWLQIVSFRQLATDSYLKFSEELSEMSNHRMAPECQMPADASDNFFLEKISVIDVEHWEPILTLMHQFVEVYEYNIFDYSALGGKIAKYIELNPGSWEGLCVAGWWCGASGRGGCARACLAAALHTAPQPDRHRVLRALAALLLMQSKREDAKMVAYLAFYLAPKSKVEAFIAALSHTYEAEYELAIWMYRYSLIIDDKFLPSKASLHASICLMLYGESAA